MAAPISDHAAVWTRSAALRHAHRKRWRTVWSIFVLAVAATTALAVAARGVGGLLFGALVAVVVGVTIALIAMGSRREIDARVTVGDGELVLDGVIPDRLPIEELTGFRIVRRDKTTTSPAVEGVRRKTSTLAQTLIDLERRGAVERHLLLNGYVAVSDDELDGLRKLLAQVLPELPDTDDASADVDEREAPGSES